MSREKTCEWRKNNPEKYAESNRESQKKWRTKNRPTSCRNEDSLLDKKLATGRNTASRERASRVRCHVNRVRLAGGCDVVDADYFVAGGCVPIRGRFHMSQAPLEILALMERKADAAKKTQVNPAGQATAA